MLCLVHFFVNSLMSLLKHIAYSGMKNIKKFIECVVSTSIVLIPKIMRVTKGKIDINRVLILTTTPNTTNKKRNNKQIMQCTQINLPLGSRIESRLHVDNKTKNQSEMTKD